MLQQHCQLLFQLLRLCLTLYLVLVLLVSLLVLRCRESRAVDLSILG